MVEQRNVRQMAFRIARVVTVCTICLAGITMPTDAQRQSGARGAAGRLIPPDSVVVFEHASNIRHTSDYAGVTMYDLDDPSPKDSIAASFQRRLADAGWKPTGYPFNPGKTADASWDVAIVDDAWMLGWARHWSDQQGNVVTINLKYDLVQKDRDHVSILPLHVMVVRLDRKTVEVLRKIR